MLQEYVKVSANINLPSASVLTISTFCPLYAFIISLGFIDEEDTIFSTRGHKHIILFLYFSLDNIYTIFTAIAAPSLSINILFIPLDVFIE